MRPDPVRLLPWLIAGLASLPSRPAIATTYLWSPTAPGSSWSAAADWTGNAAPPTDDLANTDIVYGASSMAASVVDAAYSVHSLTFNAAPTAYHLTSPYHLTVGAGGLTQSSTQTEILPAISLGADQTWTLGSGTVGAGLLNLNADGVILNGHALTLNVPNTGSLSGTIQGAAGLTKTGAGTLTLTGSSPYSGHTNVNAGTLVIGDGALLSASGVFVASGAAVNFTGTGALGGSGNSALYLDGFTAGSPATANLNGTSQIYSNGGYVGYGGSAALNQSSGYFGIAYNAFFQLGGTTGSSGTYNLTGGEFNAVYPDATVVIGYGGTGTFNQTGGTFSVPDLALAYAPNSTGTYHLNGGTLNMRGTKATSGTSTLNLNGGTLQAGADNTSFLQGLKAANVRRGGAAIDTNNRGITIAQPLLHSTLPGDPAVDGGLTKGGGGILTLTGANTYNGGTTVLSGQLIVNDDSNLGYFRSSVTVATGYLFFTAPNVSTARNFYLGTGTLSPASHGTINYTGGSTINGGTLGAGTHKLGNGTTLNGVRTTTGTVLVQTGGPNLFQNVTFGGNTTFTQTAAFTVSGTGDFVALPLTTINVAGNFSLNGGYVAGALNIGSNGQLNESNAVSGASTPLYLDGSRGVLVNEGGQLNAASGSTIELGGLLTNNGTQTGVLNVNLGGVVQGQGKFGSVNLAAASVFSAAGTIAGSLFVADGAVVSLSGSGNALTVNGALTNNGTMRFERGATLTVNSGLGNFVNNGTIDVITGGLVDPAGITNNGVVVDSSVVRVKAVARDSTSGTVTVSVDGYPGHTYQLQKSDSLASGSFANVPGVAAQSNPASNAAAMTLAFTDTSAPAGKGFYRVQVDP